MFNVNPGEMVVLALLALLVFGPDRIPEVALQVGRWVREFKAAADAAGAEITRELEAVARQSVLEEAETKTAEQRAARAEATQTAEVSGPSSAIEGEPGEGAARTEPAPAEDAVVEVPLDAEDDAPRTIAPPGLGDHAEPVA